MRCTCGEQTVKWYFEPRRDNDETTPDQDDSAPGLVAVPATVLQRHGALVLDPSHAAAIHGYPPPRSTVYRARSLLIPDYLLQDRAFITAVNTVLEHVGMNLAPVAPAPGKAGPADDDRDADVWRRLPRPAVLVPAEASTTPVVIDAWVALQALRAATDSEKSERNEKSEKRAGLDETAVQQIGLEHLLIGSAITGSPASHAPGATGEGTESSGVTGPTSTDSYTYSGGDTRAPVAVIADAPGRKPAAACATDYGRRPVVAVLDTGARVHPWLDVEPDPQHRYRTIADGFVTVDYQIQQAIHAEGKRAAASGDHSRHLISHPWDTKITADPLVGELDTDTGHGTFIAGIVRQVVPDAQVLAIRIMHGDGIVNEGDLLCALQQLAKRVALAEAGDMAAMVDVVSLSLGYFSESAADVAFSSGLRQVIDVLLGLGVTVVAAAGNYSTSRRFYPAGFTQQPLPPGQVPLIAVGALNPDGSQALFSDGGRWITAWAAGAAVISTFPTDINGSRTPEISLPGGPAALDPDDYSGGFAAWSGTSFSAPLVAAQVAGSLLAGTAEAGLRLDLPGKTPARDRALAALENLGWEG
jgi:subtilisin family serine protease